MESLMYYCSTNDNYTYMYPNYCHWKVLVKKLWIYTGGNPNIVYTITTFDGFMFRKEKITSFDKINNELAMLFSVQHIKSNIYLNEAI